MNTLLKLPLLGPDPHAPFPPTLDALEHPNGLLAWGGDLHPVRLLRAYRAGIFPWSSEQQPLLWWSPAPRCVIEPACVYLSRRTRRRHNSGVFRLTLNRAFGAVVRGCAGPRSSDEGTWITAEMIEAYTKLHHQGHAHSLEAWQGDELAGGIYGLAIGKVFFGESMFSQRSDASKIALVALCRLMTATGFELLDCQVENPHLISMGAKLIARSEFESRLARLVDTPCPASSWDEAMLAGRW